MTCYNIHVHTSNKMAQSFFLFLNSKDVDYGTSANFVVDFERSGIPFSEGEIAIGLDYVIMPNLVYPIRTNRNQVVFNEGGADKIAIIPDGYYDSSNFPAVLKTALDSAGAYTYTVTISSTTNRITISATGSFRLIFTDTSSYMWKILGFDYNSTTSSAASQTGSMPIRLDGDEYFVLQLENLPSENISSSFSTRGIMDIIPMNGAYGDVIYYTPNQINNLVLGQLNDLKFIRVHIVDVDGYDIPISDNCEIMIKLRIINSMVPYNGQ
jgi:hypothetical protein